MNITSDSFLNNDLIIKQPKNGFRSGIDAVLLAAAAYFCDFANICELGSGTGAALLSTLYRKRAAGKAVTKALAIEIETQIFELCHENIIANNFENTAAINIDGLRPNKEIENQFDLVISNPPFFDDESKIRQPSAERNRAYIIGAPLEKWLVAMLRLCNAKGEILLIHRADRMHDILNALQGRAGDIRILPIHPKTETNANRILVRAKKASKAPTQILPSLFLRDMELADNYFAEIDDMCRGANLRQFKGLFE